MKRNLLTVILLILILFSYIKPTKAQIDCVPRIVTITVGDNSPGNPAIILESELGCVYNVFSTIDGYLPVNTPVTFENVRYFPINGAITTVTGNGIIIGYQLTRLIQSQQLLYIISFDNGKELRLNPFEFETE